MDKNGLMTKMLDAIIGKRPRPHDPRQIGGGQPSLRERNRAAGQRGKRFAPAASPSTAVAASYMRGGLDGMPQQRLDFFGQLGRKETLRKGLAHLSPRMARRARRRSVEHLKMLRIAQEFEAGQANLR